jgi:hypothetical protein
MVDGPRQLPGPVRCRIQTCAGAGPAGPNCAETLVFNAPNVLGCYFLTTPLARQRRLRTQPMEERE